jgi:hypothetical protein
MTSPGLPDSLFDHGDPAIRPVQTSMMAERERPVGPIPESVYLGDNAGLISAIAPMYLTGSVLDVTYGGGAWWKRYKPAEFAHHDLAQDGVDFRRLPYEDGSWTTVCFDPPYVPVGGAPTTSHAAKHVAAFGLKRRTLAEMNAENAEGLAECARVASRWVLVKCCDFTYANTLQLGHVTMMEAADRVGLVLHDLIVHAGGTGPINHQSFKTLHRTRRAHSYLIAFDARPRRSRKAAA